MKTQTLIALAIFSLLWMNLAAQNIGVGTPNPDYTLDVNGSMGLNDFIHHNDDGEDSFLGFPGNDQLILQLGGKQVFHADAATGQMGINPMGDGITFIIFADSYQHLIHADPINARVGIGTSSPEYILDVGGDFRVFGDSYQHLLQADVISGRVGVNNSNPQFDLDVNGTLNTENLSIRGQTVFSRFQSGHVPIAGFDNNNGLTVIQINFNQSFSSPPRLVTTFKADASDPNVVVNLTLREVTTDFAKVMVYRVDNSNPVMGGEINWMAWE